MAGTIEGPVLFGVFKMMDTFNWLDPTTNQTKPIISYKVLVEQGDGTRTLESLSLPPNYRAPDLKPGSAYGFPVLAKVNRKKLIISWTLRADLMPFPAPSLQ